jgi:hypothetical protein
MLNIPAYFYFLLTWVGVSSKFKQMTFMDLNTALRKLNLWIMYIFVTSKSYLTLEFLLLLAVRSRTGDLDLHAIANLTWILCYQSLHPHTSILCYSLTFFCYQKSHVTRRLATLKWITNSIAYEIGCFAYHHQSEHVICW